MTLKRTAQLSILAFIAVTVAGLLTRPLIPAFETRYASVAWAMYLDRDFLVPHLNGALYPHKPPLLFWLINIVWWLTGVSELAARLVAPAFAAGSLVLIGVLARRLWPEDRDIGAYATIILASMSAFLISGGLTMFDAMLTFATLLGMIALVDAVRGGGWRNWALFGAAIALGVFSKGPVILIHLLPAALAYPLWTVATVRAPFRQVAGGLAIALAVALILVGLWLVPAVLTGGPEYREAVLWNQSAGRVTKSFAHARSWWYYVAVLPLMGFPWLWSPDLLRAIPRIPLRETGVRLCLIWAGAALLLFSTISGKQPHYLLPELAALALLLARAIPAIRPRFRWNAAIIPMAILAGLLFVAASGLIPLGRVEALLQPRILLVIVGLALVALIWISLRLRDYRGTAVLGLGFVLLYFSLVGFSETSSIYDPDRIGKILAANESGGTAVAGQTYYGEFNFAGRLKQPVAVLKGQQEISDWADAHPDGVIIGRQKKAGISWAPRESLLFRNSFYQVWFVSDRDE